MRPESKDPRLLPTTHFSNFWAPRQQEAPTVKDMGRQFRFFILPSDANALVEQLRTRFKSKLLVENSRECELFELDLPYKTNAQKHLQPVCKPPGYYLAPPSSIIIRDYHPKPNRWIVDSDSEAVEFSDCVLNGNILIIGRLWYQPNIVRNGKFVTKSSEFLRWAEAVYRYAKKLLQYDSKIDAYVGEEAARFRQQGGQFAHFIRPDGKVVLA